ncbi:riboflavin synthase subunit alpha [Candidatus Fukatsuia symbiotica]|uniref:Riboflavin synthase n=1 Tax=Candidatus Fukatsuia symbiotica TaxID=1878942 RepID=A0A2U8I5E3_9GAMM|nr:riboflavin synthase subunit alpha [Candidatus Fukatsuia symbiotica]AWK14348.1 riboflavin synthase subunit alpha [Candidatus Fukatsuia symbiotica]MEA9444611.1 riboflavin synthase subunit alpha [Candidatus Fukatsuia symbiotica]
MFTGIVQGTAPVVAIDQTINFRTHTLKFPPAMLPGLTLGASVAHNGCCLSVTTINKDLISFDLIKETLLTSNLGELNVGDSVNLERAARFGDEIGGHLMSGHIICTAEIAKICTSENNHQLWFRITDKKIMNYVLHKGFIAIDGISLTVGEVEHHRFCVNLIPETLARTTLGKKRLADRVNIEIDAQTQAIVDTVTRMQPTPSFS